MKEIWKEVAGYEGKYWVSNLGRVKSKYLGETIFKPTRDRLGYLRVNLVINKKPKPFLVHRLVALHFIPNPRGLNEINHIDGNKENNCVNNLEWCTRKENMEHAKRMGLIAHPPMGENNPRSKFLFQFDLNGNLLKAWKGVVNCAKRLLESDENVQKEYDTLHNLRSNITACLNGRHKTCCGYIFSFEPEINPEDYKWKEQVRMPVTAVDMDTGEIFNFPGVHFLDNYIMPNGKRAQATIVSKACRGLRKSHAGYFWSYSN